MFGTVTMRTFNAFSPFMWPISDEHDTDTFHIIVLSLSVAILFLCTLVIVIKKYNFENNTEGNNVKISDIEMEINSDIDLVMIVDK